jgi:hypothetical protein
MFREFKKVAMLKEFREFALCRGGGAAAGGRGWGCRERRFRQLGLYTAYALQGIRFPKEVSIIQNGRTLGKLRTQRIAINTGELSTKPADLKPVLGPR